MKVKHLTLIAGIFWFLSSVYFWVSGLATEFNEPETFIDWYSAFGVILGGAATVATLVLFVVINWDEKLF